MVRTITELEKVLIQKSKTPDEAAYFLKKGVKLGEEKKYAEAIACYEEAIRIDPTDEIAKQNKTTALQQQRGEKT